MIFIIIGLAILLYGFSNVKKAFLIFLIFKMFLVTNITMVSIPGVPLLTLDLFMTICFSLLIYFRRRKIKLDRTAFPYWKPFKWLMISWFFSTVFAYVGFGTAVSAFVKDLFLLIVTPYLMWLMITDKKDILFLLKWIAIVMIPICIYGIYEYTIQSNPLAEYETTLISDKSKAINFSYGTDDFRGYRVQSVFEHAIGAGINWGMFIVLYFTLKIKLKFPIGRNVGKLSICAILLSMPCVIFSNSRAPLVFIMISSLAFINLRSKKFYRYIFIAALLGIIVLPYFSDYANNLLSIFNSSAREKVGGSTSEMRFEQLGAAFALMMKSPLFGLGYKFLTVIDNSLTDAILGMESTWFQILTTFGMLGVVSNIVYVYFSLVVIPKKYGSLPVLFISLAYWMTASMTSVPGMLMYFYFLIIICFIKLSPKYNSQVCTSFNSK
jgi:O-Antigen ligase.